MFRQVRAYALTCNSPQNPAQSALKSVRAKIMKRLIVGLSGASGAIYGVRLLQVLRSVADVETHLVMSQAAR